MFAAKEQKEMQPWIAVVRMTEHAKVAEQIHASELHADVTAGIQMFRNTHRPIEATMMAVLVVEMTREILRLHTHRLLHHQQRQARPVLLRRQAATRTPVEIAEVTHEAAAVAHSF